MSEHPEVKIPDDAHGRKRYESAKRHAAAAKAAGKSNDEIHAVFKRVMAFDPKTDLDKLPQDAAHAKYRTAVIHAQKALANGKSSEEAHSIFKKIMAGETSGCTHKKE